MQARRVIQGNLYRFPAFRARPHAPPSSHVQTGECEFNVDASADTATDDVEVGLSCQARCSCVLLRVNLLYA